MPDIDGCIACLPETDQRALMATMLARLAGNLTLSRQAVVAVNGDDDTLVSAAASGITYREVQIQNLGTTPVFVRMAAGAANTGANGEFVLKAGDAANDGKGGTYTITGWLGVISAASASAANVSVVEFTS